MKIYCQLRVNHPLLLRFVLLTSSFMLLYKMIIIIRLSALEGRRVRLVLEVVAGSINMASLAISSSDSKMDKQRLNFECVWSTHTKTAGN